MIFGYCRISRKTQNVERQVKNILEKYPTAKIFQEAFTGTRLDGRKELNKILKLLQPGDTLVFDSVSRMSRNCEEGVELYFKLFEKDVNLVFLREPQIDSATYRKALQQAVPMTGTSVDLILAGINEYLKALAAEQIRLAFQQAQKEVDDLHTRTSEGIETARRAGKQIGQKKGAKLTTKKSIEKKAEILKHSKDFNGTLSDIDCLKLTGLSRNTYYKYKREIREQLEQQEA